MANEILDPDELTVRARQGGGQADDDLRAFGPGETTDSDSDLLGSGLEDDDLPVPADIAPDRIVGAEEVGLGGGLDQAEEAQLGVTDEELAERRRRPSP